MPKVPTIASMYRRRLWHVCDEDLEPKAVVVITFVLDGASGFPGITAQQHFAGTKNAFDPHHARNEDILVASLEKRGVR